MKQPIHRNALKTGYQLHWYRIESVLGQGGFGITYLARDLNLRQLVAIKEYLPREIAVREQDLSVQPAIDTLGAQFKWGLDRFIDEARTLHCFKHPNIVRVFSVFEANGTGYMVMEYEDGEDLKEILDRRITLKEDEILEILRPILDGLETVHEHGFIHRDIKPANIVIRADGSPVLIDFGSARQALGALTLTLTTLVSPGFAPFEQYFGRGQQQGPWTDIYSLGATLYRAITGEPPHDAVDRSRILLESAPDPLEDIRKIGQGRYSAHFLNAIHHALSFRANERPQKVAEWRREFLAPQLAPQNEVPQVLNPKDDPEATKIRSTEASIKPVRPTDLRGNPRPEPVKREKKKVGRNRFADLREGLPDLRKALLHRRKNLPDLRKGLPVAIGVLSFIIVGVSIWVYNDRTESLPDERKITQTVREAGVDPAALDERRKTLRDRIEALAAAAAADARKALAENDAAGARAAIQRSRDLKAQVASLTGPAAEKPKAAGAIAGQEKERTALRAVDAALERDDAPVVLAALEDARTVGVDSVALDQRRKTLRDRIQALAAAAAADAKKALAENNAASARTAIQRSRDLKAQAAAIESGDL